MVKIRLTRMGSKKKPFYRVVAADEHSPRDGRFLEILGFYDPRTKPHTLKIDRDKVKAWIERGAQPTQRVQALLSKLS